MSKVDQSDSLLEDKGTSEGEKGKVLSYLNLFLYDPGHQTMIYIQESLTDPLSLPRTLKHR